MDPATLVRAARRGAGLTQRELAERLGVSQPVIARLERRGANPTIATLDHIVATTNHSLRLELDVESGIDESMIAADLAISADQRLRRFESFYDFAKRAGEAAPRSG